MSAPSTAPGAAPSYPFDARPLVEPVPPGAARAFDHELRRTGRMASSSFGAVLGVVLALVVLVVFGSVAITMISAVLGAVSAGVEGAGGIALLFAVLPVLVIGVIAAVGITLFVRGARAGRERRYRLDRFARANAMEYLPRLDAPGLPGMIFSIGSARHALDLVRGRQPRFVEFANYRYTTGSGKNQQTHQWGYVAVKLDTPLPHIVLDATSNNGLFGASNLPLTFDKEQRLSLEGDFDRFFSLYCPADYERDALYLFTPDIMARFIDNAAALDVEIVDDWLFLYAKRDFSTLDPQTWAWLFSVVGALLDKFAQWARWRDERLAAAATAMTDAAPLGPASAEVGAGPGGAASVPFVPPLDALRPPAGVAPQGRRLQRGVPWATIIVGGVVVLFWILTQVGPAFLR
ncbi:hypothetical protein [Microbacterium hibisci]|uniref:hypothetical protein n=1 Tax=Microbacterium hibisci TaxID=2036000 RepID=UPI00194418DD|nr:hypothetical protein [Microbacterium hibisci]